MRRLGLGLVLAFAELSGCDLFAKDEPVVFDVIFTEVQLVLEPRDYRTRPAIAEFGMINNGPFQVYVNPRGFRSPEDAPVPQSVLDTMNVADVRDMPILPSHSGSLDVSYEATPTTWLNGTTKVLLDVELGAFDPNKESGSGAPIPRRKAWPDAWVTELRTIEVQVTWVCDVDEDGVLAEECGGDDCRDLNPRTGPGFDEVCDAVDNDCDGEVDEDATNASDWYPDADNDDYGTSAGMVHACLPPTADFASQAGDCGDGDPEQHPNAQEVCFNRIDDDCDGATDEGCL